MKKRNLLTLTALCLTLGLTVTACQGPQGKQGETGPKGEDGKNGEDGKTPYIGTNGNWWIGDTDTGVKAAGTNGTNGVDGKDAEVSISEDGYWVINGEKTDTKATGADGHTPVITIGEDGYWYIDGEKTETKAAGTNGTNGKDADVKIGEDGYWYINGEKTEVKAEGEDGHTPVITIGDDGCWYVDGESTGVKAQGEKGETGAAGKDAEVSISEDGYWVINGEKTDKKAVAVDGEKGDDGLTPTVEINEAGYWVINGVETDKKAVADTVTIGEDGYWYINGVSTGVKATGDAGKTYMPVIVLAGEVDGGKIKQDKYFVLPGETVTLTFNANEGNDLLTNLEVNGEDWVVEKDDLGVDATSYTFIASAEDGGYQITSAKFTSAANYVKDAVYNYYKSLSDADNQLYSLSTRLEPTAPDNDTQSVYYKKDSGALSKAVADAAITGLSSLEFEGETAEEKLDEAEEMISEYKKSIDEAYAKFLTSAKAQAKQLLETVQGLVRNGKDDAEFFTKDDRATFKAESETKVEACKTVQGLVAIVDGDTLAGKGAYNSLYNLKNNALGTVTIALEEAQGLFGDDEDLEDKIKSYGVEAELPSEVANKYYSKISKAGIGGINAVTGTDTTGTDLGDEAKKALEGCAKNVKDALINKITEKYIGYIDAATEPKKLESSVVTRLKGAVYTVVNKWLADNDSDGSCEISLYVSTEKGSHGDGDDSLTGDGLIFAIEDRLFNADSVKDNRFTDYVLSIAKTSAIAELENEYNKVVNADAMYAKAIGYTLKNNEYTGVVENWKLAEGVNVDNPVWENVNEGKGTLATATLDIANANSNAEAEENESAILNAKAWLEKLKEVETFGTEGDIESIKIQNWVNVHRGDFEKMYKETVDQFTKKVSTAINLDEAFNANKVLSTETVSKAFETATKDKGMEGILTAGQSAKASIDQVIELDTIVYEYVTGVSYSDDSTALGDKASKASEDTEFATWVNINANKKANENTNNGLSLFRNAIDGKDNASSLLAKVLGGAKAETVASSTVLDSLYAQDLEYYFQVAKTTLEESYTSLSNKALTVATKLKLKGIYDAATKANSKGEYLIGHDDDAGTDTYGKLDTFTNVAAWLKYNNGLLNGVSADEA